MSLVLVLPVTRRLRCLFYFSWRREVLLTRLCSVSSAETFCCEAKGKGGGWNLSYGTSLS